MDDDDGGRKTHANDWREQEKGLAGIGVAPAIGIGQRRPESMLKANHRQKSVWIQMDVDSGLRRNDTEEGMVQSKRETP